MWYETHLDDATNIVLQTWQIRYHWKNIWTMNANNQIVEFAIKNSNTEFSNFEQTNLVILVQNWSKLKPEKWAKATPDRSKIKNLMTKWLFKNTFYTFFGTTIHCGRYSSTIQIPTNSGRGLFEARYGIQEFKI